MEMDHVNFGTYSLKMVTASLTKSCRRFQCIRSNLQRNVGNAIVKLLNHVKVTCSYLKLLHQIILEAMNPTPSLIQSISAMCNKWWKKAWCNKCWIRRQRNVDSTYLNFVSQKKLFLRRVMLFRTCLIVIMRINSLTVR